MLFSHLTVLINRHTVLHYNNLSSYLVNRPRCALMGWNNVMDNEPGVWLQFVLS
jgi:hypothetical protein